MDILLILYAGIIPAVPLFGYDIFKKRKDKPKQYFCAFIFLLQLLISASAIIAKFA